MGSHKQNQVTNGQTLCATKRYQFLDPIGNMRFLYLYLYCSYLFSIYEKANCIAMFWTGSTHLLGSCHFRDVWATCLPHKGGGVPLSAMPKDTPSELADLFSTVSHKMPIAKQGSCGHHFLKSFSMTRQGE